MKSRVKFSLKLNCNYNIDFVNLTSSDYNYITSAYCFGTEEGTLVYSNPGKNISDAEIILSYKTITNAYINNVAWISSTTIGCASADHYLYMVDIQKDCFVSEIDCGLSNKYIKKVDEHIFVACGRNKQATFWDMRTTKPIQALHHDSTVACVEKSTEYDRIFYTACTPGTKINYWDLRYTKKGKFFAETNKISTNICTNLLYYSSNLYCKTACSDLYKISNRLTESKVLVQSTNKSYCSSLCHNTKYDVIFSCSGADVGVITNTKAYNTGTHTTQQDKQPRGLFCYNDDYIYLYSSNVIYQYLIIPRVEDC